MQDDEFFEMLLDYKPVRKTYEYNLKPLLISPAITILGVALIVLGIIFRSSPTSEWGLQIAICGFFFGMFVVWFYYALKPAVQIEVEPPTNFNPWEDFP
ncbi:MAG: hypothetical protein ACFFD4_22520 [Candidatus Odinarchaeota archaeon]